MLINSFWEISLVINRMINVKINNGTRKPLVFFDEMLLREPGFTYVVLHALFPLVWLVDTMVTASFGDGENEIMWQADHASLSFEGNYI